MYRNFDMQILRAGEEYLVQIAAPDAGNASLNFTLPFSKDGLDALLSKLGPVRQVRSMETQEEAAKRLGGQLYKAVFSAGIGSALDHSIQTANRENERLRIRLRLTNVPELANLPWEYLYDELNDRFLALSYKTSIVRYLDVPQPVSPLTVKPPLRALVMASSPIGYDALGVDKEWSNLQAALGKMHHGLVEVDRTEKATLMALQERLSGGNQYHIFHYIGHGGIDRRTGKSVLIMEDDHRQARFVDGQQLGVLLHNHPSLRIAILNACEGAVSNQNDVFTGVAQNLIKQEMPAVIAMQFEITDSVAIILAKAFYESLARNAPVDTALAEARLAVYAADNGIEWGTPVLYLRAHDGRLFDFKSPSPGKKHLRKRRIDAATPSTAELGQPIDLLFQVRFPDSSPLGLEHWPYKHKPTQLEQKSSEPTQLEFSLNHQTGEIESASLLVRVVTDDFDIIGETEKLLEVPPDEESKMLSFLLSARKGGNCRINVEVYSLKKAWIGMIPIETNVDSRSQLPMINVTHLVLYLRADDGRLFDFEPPPPPIKQTTEQTTGETTETTEDKKPDEDKESLVNPLVSLPQAAPNGTLSPTSPFYIERAAEKRAVDLIQDIGVTLLIIKPGQSGGSSLVSRLIEIARKAGKRAANMNFQILFTNQDFVDAERFYHRFCVALTNLLRVEDRVEAHWKDKGNLGIGDCCSYYLQSVLQQLNGQPLLLAMDEIDRLANAPFKSDFFAMVRSWHNNRAIEPDYQRLDLVLITSLEQHQLIDINDHYQSPFNVAVVERFEDFSAGEVTELASRYGLRLGAEQIEKLISLLGGHPYLHQLALHHLAKSGASVDALIQQARDLKSPFNSHLEYVYATVNGSPPLLQGVKNLLRPRPLDETLILQLRRAGLVQRRSNKTQFRCRLYEEYFREQFR